MTCWRRLVFRRLIWTRSETTTTRATAGRKGRRGRSGRIVGMGLEKGAFLVLVVLEQVRRARRGKVYEADLRDANTTTILLSTTGRLCVYMHSPCDERWM